MSIQPVNEIINNPELVTDIKEKNIIEPLSYNVHTDANNIINVPYFNYMYVQYSIVMDEVTNTGVPSKVGCLEHQNELTKYIINFYLNTRMIFACKRHNDQISYKKNTIKRLKKISKLI